MTSSGIFISYRRDDSAGHAGRLFDKLSETFGAEQIFMDIDTIDPGLDFIEVIDRALHSSKVVIALIGRRWTTATDSAGRRRLDSEQDFVRMEVARSLESGLRVIPVLVQGATMPSPNELPSDLQPLTRRHAIELSDVRWQYDVGRLTKAIEESLGRPVATAPDERSRTGERATGGRTKSGSGGLRGIPLAVAAVLLVALIGVAAVLLRSGDGDDDDGAPAAAGTAPLAAEEGVIAFVSDTSGSCEIHVINPDGSGEEQLTRSGGPNLRPDWSPDGKQLVYASDRDGGSAIFILDVAREKEDPLFDHPGIERGPDWSPDGRQIAFTSIVDGASEIYVLKDDAPNKAVQLTEDGSRNVTPDWSPDGSSIAYASNVEGESDIFVMNTDGTNRQNVTEGLFGGAPSNEFDPQWSPDGSLLSFESLRKGEDFDIWTIAVDETGTTDNLTAHSGDDRQSSWSPSGNKIVFGTDRRVPGDDSETGCSTDEGQRDLFVMNADGTGQRRLTRIEADDSAPAWSPP